MEQRHDDEHLYVHKYKNLLEPITSYDELDDKPKINGIELQGNKTASELGLVAPNQLPTRTSQLTNDSGFITSRDIPTIPTKTSELTNDSGYITSADVPTKTSELTNDSGYITSADVPTKTSELTNDSGYITSADVPTKTSELTNDSGFITSADVPTKTSELTNDSDFVTKQYVDFADGLISRSIPTKTSDLTNDSGFITSADLPTKTSDLTNDSGFITSANIPTKTSDLTNDSGFITASALSGIKSSEALLENVTFLADSTYRAFAIPLSRRITDYAFIVVLYKYYSNTIATAIEPSSVFLSHSGDSVRLMMKGASSLAPVLEVYCSASDNIVARSSIAANHTLSVYGVIKL